MEELVSSTLWDQCKQRISGRVLPLTKWSPPWSSPYRAHSILLLGSPADGDVHGKVVGKASPALSKTNRLLSTRMGPLDHLRQDDRGAGSSLFTDLRSRGFVSISPRLDRFRLDRTRTFTLPPLRRSVSPRASSPQQACSPFLLVILLGDSTSCIRI
eukprot:scaffold1_cov375-Pavlova_lutheri.AAC.17